MTPGSPRGLAPDLFGQLAATDPIQRRTRRLFGRGRVEAVSGNQADLLVGYDAQGNALLLREVPIISGYVPRAGDWVAIQYEGNHAGAPWVAGPSMSQEATQDSAGIGVFPVSRGAPEDPQASMVYFDEDLAAWRGYNGSEWVDFTASDHGGLGGLQGGAPGEYYHLTAAEYAGTWTHQLIAITGEQCPLEGVRTTAQTAIGVAGVLAKAITSGNMVDGFGAGYAFAIEDDAAVENIIAAIYGIRDGADNTGALLWKTATAGTLDERMRLTATALSIQGDVIAERHFYTPIADPGGSGYYTFADSGDSTVKHRIYSAGPKWAWYGYNGGWVRHMDLNATALSVAGGINVGQASGAVTGQVFAADSGGYGYFGHSMTTYARFQSNIVYWRVNGGWNLVMWASGLWPYYDDNLDLGRSVRGWMNLYLSPAHTLAPTANGQINAYATRKAITARMGDTNTYLAGTVGNVASDLAELESDDDLVQTMWSDTVDKDFWATGKPMNVFAVCRFRLPAGDAGGAYTCQVEILLGTEVLAERTISHTAGVPVTSGYYYVELHSRVTKYAGTSLRNVARVKQSGVVALAAWVEGTKLELMEYAEGRASPVTEDVTTANVTLQVRVTFSRAAGGLRCTLMDAGWGAETPVV